MQGKLVVFEGPEDANLTLMLLIFKEYCEKRFPEREIYLRSDEPNLVSNIRDLFSKRSQCNVMSDDAKLALLAAARAEVLKKQILPALERGAVVLLNRWCLSTIAYEVFALGSCAESVVQLCDYVATDLETGKRIQPDVTVYVEAPFIETYDDSVSTEHITWKRSINTAFQTIIDGIDDDSLPYSRFAGTSTIVLRPESISSATRDSPFEIILSRIQ